MNTLRVSKLEASRGKTCRASSKNSGGVFLARRSLEAKRQALEGFRNTAWRALSGVQRVSFRFLTSRVGDEHTLRVPTARDWRSRSRFQVFPSETSRVSETPWFELLNEEDLEPSQNHYGESSVVGSLCVSAGATVARLSWTLLVPSTLSLPLIESSSPAVSSSVFYLEFPF